ncbi:hypothetical protein I5Q34_08895 [Streptomyces sp. AV19]|uniref:DUF6760 family protein n=1 Tax=Streptomyces sp. AV19 TaxID=2793068 RepID=UPI0018FE2FB7|nr:DUF6760 family protein [Streptomyces sp. AV19]MBH1934403.1 hypothetical protein [Streptomyces sp. AV19]MDG4536257.1 hypothetical protein [Streptomyces sp. AV19]
MTHPADRLREEVAYIAYHFHWACADILGLPHGERRAWVREIARINVASADGGW